MDIQYLTATELSAMIREKKITVKEVLDDLYKTIDKSDFNAYTSIDKELAYEQAQEVQEKIDRGLLTGALAGVPVAVKDNISTKGLETGCASKMLQGYKPVFDATAVSKLKEAGMIVIGKTNMDEFAMGGSTETGTKGVAKNPWDPARVAGGSSGGSASGVAAGEAYLALGSDTGGSIRQPCSFCGLTGIKPTYGSVSRYGLVAYASSLDQIGPVGRNIKDCYEMLSVISGPDPKDSTAVIEKPFVFEDKADVKGLKIGLPKAYFQDSIDPDVKKSVLKGAEQFKALGAEVEEFDLEFQGNAEVSINDCAVAAYYIISSAEASSNLSRYDGIKYGLKGEGEKLGDYYLDVRSKGFGEEVKRRIMLGTFVLSSGYFDAYYKKALKVRELIKKSFDKAFEKYDVILAPVAPTTAYKIGENIQDPMKMYLGDVYTVSVNLAGIPAVSLPCGFDEKGLPIGLQLIGQRFSEPVLVKAGQAFQQVTEYHNQFAQRREG